MTFTVTSTADTDDGTCDSSCTLREAINAIRDVEGTDEIDFALAGTGPHFITLAERLPPADHVVIDGLSQSGATATAPNIFLSRDPYGNVQLWCPRRSAWLKRRFEVWASSAFKGFHRARSSFETTTTSTRA